MRVQRPLFLTFSSAVALAVGSFALALPQVLLESKGVALPNEAAVVWVRELGVAIFALGVMLFLVRRHAESPTLRAFLYGNALLQLGLLPIEIAAHQERVLTRVSGIVPNSLLHVVLALGFLACASRRDGV
jgi:hypothetical protein